ncbi:hypothetical protein Li1_1269 [Lactococcus lactis subsp. lactis]|nr:hypothetical protein Li1_1269 [Lactococcus lactis subsp. lactis]
MPFLGFFVLVMIYEGGKETKKNKIKKRAREDESKRYL